MKRMCASVSLLVLASMLGSCAGSRESGTAAREREEQTGAAGGETARPRANNAAATTGTAAEPGAAIDVQSMPAMAAQQEDLDVDGDPEDEVEDAEDQIDMLDDRLGDALAAGHCGSARSMRDRICELSDHICEIAARHRTDDDLEGECEDARERCGEARTDVADRCGL